MSVQHDMPSWPGHRPMGACGPRVPGFSSVPWEVHVGEPGSGLWDPSLSTQPLPPHPPDQVFCYRALGCRGKGHRYFSPESEAGDSKHPAVLGPSRCSPCVRLGCCQVATE